MKKGNGFKGGSDIVKQYLRGRIYPIKCEGG